MEITKKPLKSSDEFWEQMVDIGFVDEDEFPFGVVQWIIFDRIFVKLGTLSRISISAVVKRELYLAEFTYDRITQGGLK